MPLREMPAGQFKQACLRLMDEIAQTRQPLVVTKHGKPVVKLVPIDDAPASSYGALAGTVTYMGDVESPIGVDWEAGLG